MCRTRALAVHSTGNSTTNVCLWSVLGRISRLRSIRLWWLAGTLPLAGSGSGSWAGTTRDSTSGAASSTSCPLRWFLSVVFWMNVFVRTFNSDFYSIFFDKNLHYGVISFEILDDQVLYFSQVWQCHGRMIDAPCSRVGHIYRCKYVPFPNPNVGDFISRNYRRVAQVENFPLKFNFFVIFLFSTDVYYRTFRINYCLRHLFHLFFSSAFYLIYRFGWTNTPSICTNDDRCCQKLILVRFCLQF